MKHIKHLLAIACCALLLTSFASAQDAEITINTARFSAADLNVAYVYAGATMEEAQAVFGVPENTVTVTSAATGETQTRWYYVGLTLTFSGEGKLIAADTLNPAYVGPRGLAVGQTVQEAAAKFYYDMENATETVLYSAGYVELLNAQLPPCAYILVNDNGTYTLNYAAPVQPFGDDVTADPSNYVYQNLALLTIRLDAAGTVTSYTWTVGPWAE